MFERATVIGVLLASHGCSYLLIDRPPRAVRKTDSMPACTVEKTWPLVDLAVGAFGVGGGIAIATGLLHTKDNGDGTMRELTADEKVLASSASIVEGLLFLWSAYHGHETTNACRELRARMPQVQPQPYPYPYPQPGPYPQPQAQAYPPSAPAPVPAPQGATP